MAKISQQLFALSLLGILFSGQGIAQVQRLPSHPVFLDSSVATVRILIHPDSLAKILDPANADSDHEYPATFIFQNPLIRDTLQNIGFRLRGNTSRDAKKKSFKVSVNAFESGRKFYGLEKLNLNSEHNDPGVIRAKICWDLFNASGLPSSRANHTRLYINGKYYGLYINVEHVDENFVQIRYGNNDGNLYKCLWPADLAYRGADPNLYKFTSSGRRTYELTINEEIDDYTDIAKFISILNLSSSDTFAVAIQRVFNVNGFLRSLAVEIATGSWDDYWFLKNNYYLYHNTATGRFEFIPYDYDNTLGIWWTDILSGVDWGTRNVYTWGHPTEQRPLTRRIFEVPEFRNRLSFYLNRLLQRHFTETGMFPRIDSIHTLITPAAETDSFRTLDYGYTIQQFHNSYTQALGQHVRYGLKPYITTRRNSALSQLQLINVAPILSSLTHNPQYPFVGDAVTMTVRLEDESTPQSVLLFHSVNDTARPPVTMHDDGLHNDGAAGDEIYGVVLQNLAGNALVKYYVRATDAQTQISYEPPDAPASMQQFRVISSKPRLYINEFMAANTTTIRDPFGEWDDWIEIYNGDSVAIGLRNCYLTDNFSNPTKWRFPDTTIAPRSFILIWADDGGQGPLHATFKLDRSGERIGLYRGDSLGVGVIDTVSFGYQQTDISRGRIPDGGTWQALPRPSPGSSNILTGIQRDNDLPVEFALFQPYPNPFNPTTKIGFVIQASAYGSGADGSTGEFTTLRVYDVVGREVATLVKEALKPGTYETTFDASHLSSGVYFTRLTAGAFSETKRMLLLR